MRKENIIAKTGNFIKNNKVPMLYIGGAVVGVIILIPLIKRLRGVAKLDSPRALDYDLDSEELEPDLDKSTITPNMASQFANQLVGFMSISSGTDESGIKSVFEKIKNAEDMKLLYKAFGVRKYSNVNTGEASGVLFGIFENLGGYNDWDLVQWLQTELNFLDFNTKKIVNEKLGLIGYSID